MIGTRETSSFNYVLDQDIVAEIDELGKIMLEKSFIIKDGAKYSPYLGIWYGNTPVVIGNRATIEKDGVTSTVDITEGMVYDYIITDNGMVGFEHYTLLPAPTSLGMMFVSYMLKINTLSASQDRAIYFPHRNYYRSIFPEILEYVEDPRELVKVFLTNNVVTDIVDGTFVCKRKFEKLQLSEALYRIRNIENWLDRKELKFLSIPDTIWDIVMLYNDTYLVTYAGNPHMYRLRGRETS
jgi:hypothetical protein